MLIYNTFTVAAAGAGGTLAGGSNAITIDSVSVDSSVIASNLKLYIDDCTDASYIIATVTESGTGMFTAKYEGSFGKSLRVVVEDQDADGDYIKVEISEITTKCVTRTKFFLLFQFKIYFFKFLICLVLFFANFAL